MKPIQATFCGIQQGPHPIALRQTIAYLATTAVLAGAVGCTMLAWWLGDGRD